MHHLTLEELARLVDETPTIDERMHLESCERCSSALDALTIQTGMLGQLPDPSLPEPVYLRVKEMLVSEPLAPVTNRGWGQAWLRVAAGIAVFLLGAATGTFGVAPRLSERPTAMAAAPAPADAPENTATSPEDAANSLAQAEAQYLRALSEFTQYNFAIEGVDPLSRLAALEGIVLTTRAALRQAPADPIINNYHLTALGQRDALLRQLEQASDSLEWF